MRGIVIIGAGNTGIIAADDYQRPLVMTASLKGDHAIFTLEGYISKWNETSAVKLRSQIKDFKSNGAETAELELNTEGGSVFEAIEIDNLLYENFGDYKIRVGALAASAGTYLTSKRYSIAKTNSQLMIHKPMMTASGNQDKIRRDLTALDNMTDEYRDTYMAKTGKTADEIDALWNDGDYWMNAKQALKEGFINEIVTEKAKVTSEVSKVIEACGAPIKMVATIEPTTKKKPENKHREMESRLIAARLGLPEDASDAQINAKLGELQADADKVAALEAAAKLKDENDKTAKIKAILDKAEQVDKKITADVRPNYEAILKADLENGKKIIDAIPAKTKLSASINPNPKGTDSSIAAQKDWKFSDYQEKDPAAFEALLDSDPEKANSLIEAHYGKE